MDETLAAAAAAAATAADLDPNAARVLAAFRRRLERREPDFSDGAAQLCGADFDLRLDQGEPRFIGAVVALAEGRLHGDPSWVGELENFVGEEPEPSGHRGGTPALEVDAGQLEIPGCGPMALQYAALGWQVLQVHGARDGACTCQNGSGCEKPGKHPRTKNGFKDATTDGATIAGWFRRWPNANVGIRTGIESGLVVLDVDPRHGGDGSLVELQRRYGTLPDTLSANTGGGGRHLLFRHPGGSVGNPTGLDGLPGLDVRGDGGYIVAAPSTHASGGIYGWVGEPSAESVVAAPDWFYPLANTRPGGASSTTSDRRDIDSPAIPEGQRNDTLFRLGCRLRGRGEDRKAILAELQVVNETGCRPPLEPDEVERIADSAMTFEAGSVPGEPRLCAPLPDAAPEAPTEHPKLGPQAYCHAYRNSEGRELWRVSTFLGWGQPESRPLTLWDSAGRLAWVWKGPPAPPLRPLFRLPELVARPDAPVLVVVSEPAADRGAGAFVGWTATCPMFGGLGVRTADWTPVAGRNVLVWAADTAAGRTFSHIVASAVRQAGAARVAAFRHDRRPGPEGSLIAGGARLDGGDAPSPDAGWTEAHLVGLLDEGGVSAPDLLEQVSLIRDNKGESPLPSHRLNRRIGEFITGSLLERGRLYHEGEVAYAFLSDERRLVELDEDDPHCVRMLDAYGINRSEHLYKYVAHHLWVQATTHGIETVVRYLSHYDRDRNAIYVYDQGGLIYKVTTAGIEAVDNGTDGILFVGEPGANPFHLVEGFDPSEQDEDGLSPIKRMLADGLSFAPGLLTREDALRLLEAWLYGMFVPELMPTKAILALVGIQGSVKTSLAKAIGLTLFGGTWQVTPILNAAGDFDAAASATALLVLDNVDTEKDWLPDKLATLATGGALKKRVLYTTNQVASFPARCWTILTSRTPSFKRIDVAERLLLLRTAKPPVAGYMPEDRVEQRTRRRRDLAMSSLLHGLVGVAEALRDHGSAEITSDFRMADFFAFAMRVARHQGTEEAMAGAFRRLQRSQGEFAVEDDPLPDLIEIWLRRTRNVGRKVKATELYTELNALGPLSGQRLSDRYRNGTGFGVHLSGIVPSLQTRFDVAVGTSKNTAVYIFRPLRSL